MSKQEIMKRAVERAMRDIASLARAGIVPSDMPDDLLSAQAKLMAAQEHLIGRMELERLRHAA